MFNTLPQWVGVGMGMGAQKNRGWEGYGKQEGNEQEAGVLREEDGREMQNLCLG